MDFLSEILAVKRRRLAEAVQRVPIETMRDQARQIRSQAKSHAFAEALSNDGTVHIIAEFKRRSPSKGTINSEADPATTAKIYESAGAAAVSVLTEEDYFDGSLADLRLIRDATSLPILRKDFIFDEYQVYESAAARADALLLIVAALDDATLQKLRTIAEEELGMDALVEVHTQAELDRAVKCGARLIGVNNRDLRSFAVSTSTSIALAPSAPRDAILVSESGLNPQEVRRLCEAGYRGFLVGETLMRASDPAAVLREFIDVRTRPQASPTVVKICGITNTEDALAAIAAGADMLGFNFFAQSPRYIEPDAAAAIIREVRSQANGENRQAMMIGVFVNASMSTVANIAETTGLDGIQLHGDETVAYCEQLKQRSPKRFVIKAFTTTVAQRIESAGEYLIDAVMLDGFDARLRGGTGQLADWNTARKVVERLPRVFLAGGLSPENVGAAIAAVRPYAVDACSSLEVSPGKKSAKRMKEFVDAVRMSKLPTEGK